MTRIEYSAEFRLDFAEIGEILLDYSEKYAKRVTRNILDRCRSLRANPGLGRERPELGPTIRSFAAGHYIIYFEHFSKGIRILRVLHGARDIAADDFQ